MPSPTPLKSYVLSDVTDIDVIPDVISVDVNLGGIGYFSTIEDRYIEGQTVVVV